MAFTLSAKYFVLFFCFFLHIVSPIQTIFSMCILYKSSPHLYFLPYVVCRISPEGVDILLDCLCGENTGKGLSLLKPLGTYILYGRNNSHSSPSVWKY